MVKHIWSVLCKESVVNQENNALSLMNIFEGLQVEVKEDAPKDLQINIPIQYEIVTLLKKDKKDTQEKVTLKVSLIDPNGILLTEPITIPIELKKGMLNHRHRLKNFGIKITVPGEYKFIVEMKSKQGEDYKIASLIPLEVSINKQK